MSNHSGRKLVLRNIAWHSSEKVLRLFTGLFVGLWLARYLGPESYGSFNYVYAWLGLFNAFAWLGVGDTVMRDMVRDRSDEDRIMGSALMIRLVGSLLAVVSALAAARWIGQFNTEQLILLAILCVGVPFAEAPAGITLWFASHTNIRPVVIGRILTMIIGALARVAVILTGSGLLSLMSTFAAEAVIGCVCLVSAYRMNGQALSAWRYDVRHAWSMLLVGLPIITNALVVSLNARVDQLLLGHLSGMTAVGIYAAAMRFSEIWWIVPPVIMQSVAARYIYPKDLGDRLQHNMSRIVAGMALASLAPCLLLSAVGTNAIGLVLGNKYQAAGPVLLIHIWIAVLVFIDAPTNQYLLATNRQRLLVLKSGLLLCSNITLAWLLIPRLGAPGAALGMLGAQCLVVLVLPWLLPTLKDVRRIHVHSVSEMPRLVASIGQFTWKAIRSRLNRH